MSWFVKLFSLNKILGYVVTFGILEIIWALMTNQPGNALFGAALMAGGFWCLRKLNAGRIEDE